MTTPLRTALSEAAGRLLDAYNPEGLADCLDGFAALALRAGEAEEAAVLAGAADATRERGRGNFLFPRRRPPTRPGDLGRRARRARRRRRSARPRATGSDMACARARRWCGRGGGSSPGRVAASGGAAGSATRSTPPTRVTPPDHPRAPWPSRRCRLQDPSLHREPFALRQNNDLARLLDLRSRSLTSMRAPHLLRHTRSTPPLLGYGHAHVPS